MSRHELESAILAAILYGCTSRAAIFRWLSEGQYDCTESQFTAAKRVLIKEGSIEQTGACRGARYRVVDSGCLGAYYRDLVFADMRRGGRGTPATQLAMAAVSSNRSEDEWPHA
jgi:hypothetical protein